MFAAVLALWRKRQPREEPIEPPKNLLVMQLPSRHVPSFRKRNNTHNLVCITSNKRDRDDVK